MKSKIIAITAAALMLFTVICATAQEVTNVLPNLSVNIPPDVKSNAVSIVQGVSVERNITLSIAPSYAPDLINKDGVKDQWGATVALTYHPQGSVSKYLFTGIRLDYLGSQFYAPSVNGGMKADVQLFGINATPFAYGGVAYTISGAGSANGDFGSIYGGGIKVQVWNGKLFKHDSDLSIFAAAEKWSQLDGAIYHLGPSLRIAW